TEKIDGVDKKLSARIDSVEQKLTEKIDGVDKKLSARIDSVEQKLTEKIDGIDKKLSARIDSVEQKLTEKIDGVDKKLSARIDGLEQNLSARIDGLEARMADFHNYFYWIIVLLGIILVLPMVQKFFQWREGRKETSKQSLTIEDVEKVFKRLMEEQLKKERNYGI
ncbi:MAG: apolipoprotein A1/A4/E family protein, partial [Synergistaceae bacterium]|nr:apolipoprotein A1/A4/E family protein [Synergistaceae bacterium]